MKTNAKYKIYTLNPKRAIFILEILKPLFLADIFRYKEAAVYWITRDEWRVSQPLFARMSDELYNELLNTLESKVQYNPISRLSAALLLK